MSTTNPQSDAPSDEGARRGLVENVERLVREVAVAQVAATCEAYLASSGDSGELELVRRTA